MLFYLLGPVLSMDRPLFNSSAPKNPPLWRSHQHSAVESEIGSTLDAVEKLLMCVCVCFFFAKIRGLKKITSILMASFLLNGCFRQILFQEIVRFLKYQQYMLVGLWENFVSSYMFSCMTKTPTGPMHHSISFTSKTSRIFNQATSHLSCRCSRHSQKRTKNPCNNCSFVPRSPKEFSERIPGEKWLKW